MSATLDALRRGPGAGFKRPVGLRMLALELLGLAIIASLLIVVLPPQHGRTLLLVLLWASAGVAWNLISGQVGQILFGPVAFIGIAAYIDVFFAVHTNVPPILAIFPAALGGMAGAVVLAVLALRLSGIYFALTTLAFPLILTTLVFYFNVSSVAIPNIASGKISDLSFSSSEPYAFLALAILLLAFVFSGIVERTALRAPVTAVRVNPILAESMGVQTTRIKFAAFFVGAFVLAAMGVVYIHGVTLSVTADAVLGLPATITIITVTIIGGIGRLWGPVLGAALIVPLVEYLRVGPGRDYPGLPEFSLGVLVVLFMAFAPTGILGIFRRAKKTAAVVPLEVAGAEPAAEAAVFDFLAAGGAPRPFVAEALHLAYGGNHVLDGFSLRVDPGEIVGLIGPNGAGKTSFVNVCSGVVRPLSGRVVIGAQDVTLQKPYLRSHEGIARTFQTPQVLDELSALDNITLALGGTWARGDLDIARNLLTLVQCRHDVPASELTLRELRFLELARALSMRPSVVLLDEPFAGLSAEEIQEYSGLCMRIAKRSNIGFIVVEHQVDALRALVDRFVVMDRGSVLAEGGDDDVFGNDKVREVYLGTPSGT